MPRGVLLLELGAIVLGLAVFARLAVSIGLSPIPLYLLAGLAFGKAVWSPSSPPTSSSRSERRSE